MFLGMVLDIITGLVYAFGDWLLRRFDEPVHETAPLSE